MRLHVAALAALVMLCTNADARPRHNHHRTTDANGNYAMEQYSGRIIGGRPSGCPRAFCGCEASLYLFGKIRPELNLASNWIRKFPRAIAAPRMAAARNGHVMILISHVSGNDWLVHDGNSGGGRTREHVRSISGYVIVNPTPFMASVAPSLY